MRTSARYALTLGTIALFGAGLMTGGLVIAKRSIDSVGHTFVFGSTLLAKGATKLLVAPQFVLDKPFGAGGRISVNADVSEPLLYPLAKKGDRLPVRPTTAKAAPYNGPYLSPYCLETWFGCGIT